MSGYTFSDIAYPDGTATTVNAINNAGSIIGNYEGNRFEGSFVYAPDGQYTAFLPDGTDTHPSDINEAGDITGEYSGASTDSFLYTTEALTDLTGPLSGSSGVVAVALNNSDEVVGYYGAVANQVSLNGFSYIGGKYTTFTAPGAAGITSPTAVNDSGDITGWYLDSTLGNDGFLLSDGTFTQIDVPVSSGYTVPTAINGTSMITGSYRSDTGSSGFIYANGTYTTIATPAGTTFVQPVAINAAGEVAGYYSDAPGMTEGFVYKDGVFTSVSDPNAIDNTEIVGLNDEGTIIGTYRDVERQIHSFVAELACFAAGTRIRTRAGEVVVEHLGLNDEVLGIDDKTRLIRWIGHRDVDCRRHPRPEAVLPVCISADAFGPGQPAHDLYLSPDHAILVDGVLIPIKHLINGRSIIQIDVAFVTYFHIELERHDVLMAEGLPCESYLDTGCRNAFANGDSLTMLHPDFDRQTDNAFLWETLSYAPLVVSGPVFERVRERLKERANLIGEAPHSLVASAA